MHLLEDHFIFRCMHTSKLSNLLTSLELNIHATFALTRARNFTLKKVFIKYCVWEHKSLSLGSSLLYFFNESINQASQKIIEFHRFDQSTQ